MTDTKKGSVMESPLFVPGVMVAIGLALFAGASAIKGPDYAGDSQRRLARAEALADRYESHNTRNIYLAEALSDRADRTEREAGL